MSSGPSSSIWLISASGLSPNIWVISQHLAYLYIWVISQHLDYLPTSGLSFCIWSTPCSALSISLYLVYLPLLNQPKQVVTYMVSNYDATSRSPQLGMRRWLSEEGDDCVSTRASVQTPSTYVKAWHSSSHLLPEWGQEEAETGMFLESIGQPVLPVGEL